MEKQWIFLCDPEAGGRDSERGNRMPEQQSGIPEQEMRTPQQQSRTWEREIRTPKQIIRQLLAAKELTGPEAEAEFLSDKPKRTYDPFLMKNMEASTVRILQAAEKGESICIYGDYDTDGVTAVSLMLEILSQLTSNVSFYIPSRMDEGYGLNRGAIETIAACGVRLMITVDCGSVSWEEVELAKQLGMDVIVTDHHSTAERKLADCLLLNPKQDDCTYPYDGLCGCGVAFKLAQALQRTSEKISKKILNRQLDLAAISTIGDIVPLTDENRTLVKYGIRGIAGGGRIGLEELLKQAGLKSPELTSDQIAFTIVPHLNAAGRMGAAGAGVELLTAGRLTCLTEITSQGMRTTEIKPGQAAEIAREKAALLVEYNKERRQVQERTYQDCLKLIDETHKDDLFYVINAGQAHEGIAGIVAGKIKEACFRPAILVTESGDSKEYWKGTGRSVEGLDLFQLLSGQEERFVRFGGHAGACGFLMERDQLEPLREALNQAMAELLAQYPQLLIPKLMIADRLSPGELSTELAEALKRLSPYGNSNPKPCFALSGLIVEKAFYMGAEKQHVKLTVKGKAGGSGSFECLLFQRASEFSTRIDRWIREREPVEAAGSLDINEWNGRRSIQIILEDIH